MSELTRKQIAECKQDLLRLQSELTEQLQISQGAADVVTLDQSRVGRVSRMDAMQQQGMALSTRNKVTSRLRRIAMALAAIGEGEYGYCRRCDEAIGAGRLRAQPEAVLCINCQGKADQQ